MSPSSDKRVIVSFDIDGTIDVGDPPGPISVDLVRLAKRRGYIVGTCSDRTQRDQRELLERNQIVLDFVSYKYELEAIRLRFGSPRCIHIGDSTVDEYHAVRAGFEFWFPHELPADGTDGWIF